MAGLSEYIRFISVFYVLIAFRVCHNELSIFVWQIYRKQLQNINICFADILILLLYIMYLFK